MPRDSRHRDAFETYEELIKQDYAQELFKVNKAVKKMVENAHNVCINIRNKKKPTTEETRAMEAAMQVINLNLTKPSSGTIATYRANIGKLTKAVESLKKVAPRNYTILKGCIALVIIAAIVVAAALTAHFWVPVLAFLAAAAKIFIAVKGLLLGAGSAISGAAATSVGAQITAGAVGVGVAAAGIGGGVGVGKLVQSALAPPPNADVPDSVKESDRAAHTEVELPSMEAPTTDDDEADAVADAPVVPGGH